MITLHAIVLGIVEGITEFLPVSSTAHLDIVRGLMGIPVSDFVKSFEIVIQLGAILAVLVLYFRKIFFSDKNHILSPYVVKTTIAFIPTGIIGFALYKLIKNFLLGNTFIEIGALIVGGIFILLFERFYKLKNTEKDDFKRITLKELLIIGVAQSIAVIPGVSRSLTVIITGRLLGLSKPLATEFSFFLAIPTIFMASLYDLYKVGFYFASSDWIVLLAGFSVSFLVAMGVIRLLLVYIQNNSFRIFGWYRILLGFVLFWFLF